MEIHSKVRTERSWSTEGEVKKVQSSDHTSQMDYCGDVKPVTCFKAATLANGAVLPDSKKAAGKRQSSHRALNTSLLTDHLTTIYLGLTYFSETGLP